MREKQYAGGVAALGCLFLLVMRTLSPWFWERFDWIALGLTALAAAGVLLPVMTAGRPPRQAPTEPVESARSDAALALKDRAARLGWSTPEGGVYDALIKLSRRNPQAALSGAYATLTLLLNSSEQSRADADADPSDAIRALVRRKRLLEPEASMLQSVADTLDEYCGCGVILLDQSSRDALLDASLSSIAFLERLA
ncbi:MAG: hypothetical protein LBH66_09285 [Oscillospiraceae bacterium]|jgi:hypothetical protein|nr:hypothetical protein [Oscillospiraceae bacterium]